MRLHRLALTGVGPFLARQEIDFDDLSGSGLFLIDGPTGSGKSTIIDSIVYALYGVVAGGNDSDAGRMRSHYCTETDPSGVLCEFTVDGRRHRITRVPKGARDPEEPSRAATAKPARQTLTEYAADGSVKETLTKDGDITAHVVDLLGMTADQFRQLVVLPQGQFADLLRMTPTERLSALSTLLGDEFFTRVQNDLIAQGGRAEAESEAAREHVSRCAQQLRGRLLTHLEGLPEPEVDFTDAAAQDEQRERAVATVLELLAERAEAAEAARTAQAAAEAATRFRAEQARAVAEALSAVGVARAAVSGAEAALAAEDVGVAEADVSPLVDSLHVLEGTLVDHAAWEAQAADRDRDRTTLAADGDAEATTAEQLGAQRAAIPVQRREIETHRSAAQALAATAVSAAREEVRLSSLLLKAEQLTALAPQVAALASAVEEARSRAAGAVEQAGRARSDWAALIDRQRGQRAAALAVGLVDGAACPVCGSAEHPAPAAVHDGVELVPDADVERAEQLEAGMTQAAARAAEESARAQSAWQDATRDVAALAGALGGLTPEEVAGQHAAAARQAEAAASAEAELAQIDAGLLALADREGELEALAADHAQKAATLRATVSAMRVAEDARRAQIGGLIGDAESATALLAATRARVAALGALQQAHVDLARAAVTVPIEQRGLSVEEAQVAAASAAAEFAHASEQLAGVTEVAAGLAAVVDEARPLQAALGAALASRRGVVDRTAATVTLAALVNARNSRSLPLRSYALQRRFASVLAAASVHLERMSAGKFSFELSETVGRGNAGLGISVHDAWTGQQQEPKSLSGGETFYASLSLALGLADVVRGEAGGSALETLFIDEGFGSLDQDTLYQVLDQLDELRAGRRAVGVVSHVTEMKESIPDRLEVRRQADRTSTVSRSGR